MVKTIRTVLQEGTHLLERTSPSPRLDTELIVAAHLGVSRTYLLAHGEEGLSVAQEQVIQGQFLRRAQGEPVAYLIGKQEFWSLEFEVSPAVLIPRPETELLVELALTKVVAGGAVVDLGTGSGCIAIALAVESKKRNLNLTIVASDRSSAALGTARRNAARHQVEALIDFRKGRWWEPFSERFTVAVSNPPYIAAGDNNVSPETRFEPEEALYAHDDGLSDVREIVRGAPSHLYPGGALLIEFGSSQGSQVRELPCAPLIMRGVHQDLASHDRVGEWQLPR